MAVKKSLIRSNQRAGLLKDSRFTQGANVGNSSTNIVLPSLVNGRGSALGGKSQNVMGRTSQRPTITRSLPTLVAQREAKPEGRMLTDMRLTCFQRFLKGYYDDKDAGGSPKAPSGASPHGIDQMGLHSAVTSNNHVSNALAHVTADGEEKRFRQFFGRALSEPSHSSKMQVLANVRHRHLKQRHFRADSAFELPWDALGSNSHPARRVTEKIKWANCESTKLNKLEDAHIEVVQSHPSIDDCDREECTQVWEACKAIRRMLFEHLNAFENVKTCSWNEYQRGTLCELRCLGSFLARPDAVLSFEDVFLVEDFSNHVVQDRSRNIAEKQSRNGNKRRASLREAAMASCSIRKGLHALQQLGLVTGDEYLQGRCSLQDLLRLIWPRATQQDMRVMKGSILVSLFEEFRVPTPPLLSEEKKQELIRNFEYLAANNAGTVRYADLVHAGLVNLATMSELKERYDHNNDGIIQCLEFVEMLCPPGFLSHDHQHRMVDSEGNAISHIIVACDADCFTGWVFDRDIDRMPVQCWKLVSAKFPEDQKHMVEVT